MTEKEILEGNKLIAEFMGGKRIINEGWMIPNISDLPKDSGRSGLKYHSSWDWLMPVVEKINENPKEHDISIEARGVWLTFMNDGRIEKALIAEHRLIECAWLMVLDFIQWYNTQKQTP